MKITENAKTLLERRYLAKDKDGKVIEDIPGLFHRVAKAVASADLKFDSNADVAKTEEEFYEMMTNLRFLPNSPTLMNAGKPLGQLSACFVLPVGDSMEEIFDAVKSAALIHKSGGGTGFSFSRLRPAGAVVQSTGGVASGSVSFMKVFNSATEAVKQGGTRRGANMGMLRVDHPDILEFIDCKENNNEINNFNISIAVTDKFMDAVAKNESYELVDPHTREVVGTLDANMVFEKIVDAAWRNGEPGIVFIDKMNRANPTPWSGEIEATNPCGEQPLLPYEACNLGSINLVEMYHPTTDGINWTLLRDTVIKAVHFLDNVIEINKYPLDIIAEKTLETRKIGLGVMGWADLLFRLKIPYGSEESIKLADRIMGFINETAYAASFKMAKQRGSYPIAADNVEVRNATRTTIAPTGSISMIANVSSGIEPLFAISFIRNVMDNTEMVEVNPYFEQIAKENGFYSEELMKRIAKEGSVAHIEEIPAEFRNVFVTAHDVSPEAHVRMQAAWQRHTDNAVSKTINFSNDATREDVKKAYLLAHETDCKGITVYRDGSRNEQVLNIGSVKRDGCPVAAVIEERPRPVLTKGITEKVQIGCGNLYVTVNSDENGICEVFTTLGKGGGCPSQSEATSRLISIALRYGVPVDAIVEQLKGIRCHSTLRQMNQKGIKVLSCPDAIGRVISKVAKNQNEPVKIEQEIFERESVKSVCDNKCPECGAVMEHEGGCVVCRTCGYSKCG